MSGGPASTVFCHLGHLVQSTPEGSFEIKNPEKCQWCGSDKLFTLLSWHSRDEDTCLIPHDPIRYEWTPVWSETIHGEIKLPIYDVSKVTKWTNYHVVVHKVVEAKDPKGL